MRAFARAAPILAVYLGVALPAASFAARPSPASLSGAHFFPIAFVERIERLGFAALPPIQEAPPHVAFVAPGQLELRGEGRRLSCSFTAEGNGFLWALRLTCGGVELERQWTWLPSGAAWTDLIEVEDGEVAPLRFPEPPAAPVAPPRVAASPPAVASPPAGTWRGPDGAELVISPEGTVILAGKPVQAQLRTCVHVQVPSKPQVPCLSVTAEGPGSGAFALLEGNVWVEGKVGADGAFEGWRAGRFFGSAQTRAAPSPP